MAAASARRGTKPVLLLLAKLALSAGLMAFLFHRIPAASIAAALQQADRRGLAAAAALLLVSHVLGSYQWARLLEVAEIRIPFWKTWAYYHVGLFFNNFLPANIGGDIARVMDASRHGPDDARAPARPRAPGDPPPEASAAPIGIPAGAPVAAPVAAPVGAPAGAPAEGGSGSGSSGSGSGGRVAAFSTVLMDRLVGTLALVGLALVTTLPAVDRFHLSLIYLVLASFFALSVLVLWAVFHPALLPMVERLLGRVGLNGLRPGLEDLAGRLGRFRGQRRLLLVLFLVATVTQVSRIGVHVLVSRALGLHIALPYFFLFVPLLAVIVSLPISLNGIGVREGAGVVLFGLVGVSRAQAFSLQFTTYLVAVAVSLVGGVVFLVRLPVRRARSRSRGRPA